MDKTDEVAEAPAKKKEGAEQQQAKKPKREANLAEKAKDKYKKVPPPDSGKTAKGPSGEHAKPRCQYCLGGGGHANNPKDCFVGSRDAVVPQGIIQSCELTL